MLKFWKVPNSVQLEVARLPDHDEILRDTMTHGKVIVGFAVERKIRTYDPPNIKARYVVTGETPQPFISEFSSAVKSLPLLESAVAGNGALTFIPDIDGVVRKVPLLVRIGEDLVPSFAAEVLRVAQGKQNYTVRMNPEKGVGLSEVRIGDLTIPTTAHGEVIINYTKPVAHRYIPAWKLLTNNVSRDELAGRIVLIGTSAQALMDLRFSPMGGVMPGIEMQAQVIEQLLTNSGLMRPSWAPTLEALIIFFGGFMIGILVLRTGVIFSFTAISFSVIIIFAAAWEIFVENRLLLEPMTPSIVLIVTYILSSVVRHFSTERHHRWIKQAFARYISPNLVSYLIKHPHDLELGGQRKECSFVFTDLANFTNLIEGMDPSATVNLLNDYLESMVTIAFDHQGTLDRIVGDAVAVMFSAPVTQTDHKQRALACALDMKRFSADYVSTLKKKGIVFGQTRIGIHSGEVIVGNFGGKTIFDYRALGDSVNTASRLETANKYFGTSVCVSEETLSACPDWPTRPIGRIIFKGKSIPLMVYEMLDHLTDVFPDTNYDKAFTLLHSSSPDAIHAFEQLSIQRPNDKLISLHLMRLRSGFMDDIILLTEK